MTSLFDRRLLVVTGKGGTGKTTTAAALALLAAREGKRVLLCELDRSGDVASAFELDELSFEPRLVHERLSVMVMDTEAALVEYLKLNLKIPWALKLGPFARAFDFIATAAPGAREVLTIGKLCWEVKRDNYDLVIADAPASGHIVGQLATPGSIGSLIDAGPLQAQTGWMQEMLTDPQRTAAVVVTVAEEVAASETMELVARLRTETATSVGAIVVNRCWPEVAMAADRAGLVIALGSTTDNASLRSLLELAQFGQSVRDQQVAVIKGLRSRLDSDFPMAFIDQTFDALAPADVVASVIDGLASELS